MKMDGTTWKRDRDGTYYRECGKWCVDKGLLPGESMHKWRRKWYLRRKDTNGKWELWGDWYENPYIGRDYDPFITMRAAMVAADALVDRGY